MRYIAITAIVLLLLVSIHAQNGTKSVPIKCDHTSSSKERFDAIRLLPPSKIFWDGKTVTARYEDAEGLYVEELTTDETTAIHIPRDYKGKYFWLLYSTCDRHVYTILEITPNQFK